MTLAQYGGVKCLGSARCASYLPRLQCFRSLVSESGGCMYRIAIVEDNPESYEKLTKYLKRYSEEYKVPLKSTVFTNGLNFISDYRGDYDVVLMDIEMPNMDGMTAARRLRQMDEDVPLLFVTNLAQYAIEGYEVRALDFLVKPVQYPNFVLKLQKALELIERRQNNGVVLKCLKGIRRVRIKEIHYIEVMDHILIYHTTKGQFEERCSIKEREVQLEAYGFARCSNSYLVNLEYVTAVSGNTVTVAGDAVPVGRTKKKEFLRRLTEYMGDTI